MCKDKTRQDKTRQDKTRQDKTKLVLADVFTLASIDLLDTIKPKTKLEELQLEVIRERLQGALAMLTEFDLDYDTFIKHSDIVEKLVNSELV